jgi:DNA modification methylase
LRELPDCSVDSVVTDPPYGLSFMGKKWDYDVPSVELWAECLRVLKPGGHLLAFAGTRTQHRMAVRIEDAGFEIRDMIAWVYGSGFPKSLDVSKALDKMAGAEREVVGKSARHGGGIKGNGSSYEVHPSVPDITAPATDAAIQWQGWGTALKPALEPITVARKPLGEKTVAANVLEHGTGAINVDGCRIAGADTTTRHNSSSSSYMTGKIGEVQPLQESYTTGSPAGRWPANLIHDGSDEVDSLLNSAARFFYCAKASKKDRDEGVEGEPKKASIGNDRPSGTSSERRGRIEAERKNNHPTVKPTALMRYLCRLVTQPGGVVLDPFMGSGSTGKAAVLEGFQFIGIEREGEYLDIATRRIADVSPLSGLRNILDSSPRNDTSGHEQPS